MRYRIPTLVLSLSLILVLPSAAQAATLTFSRPCFAAVPGSGADQPITFSLTGGTPGQNYTVSADFPGNITATDVRGVFDATGNAVGSFSSYSIRGLGIDPSRGRQATFTAKQGPNLFGQTPIAQASVTATNAALTISRSSGSAFRKRTWRMSGIKPLYGASSTYYASWVKGTKGKRVVKRSKLGSAKGACGYLAVKRVLPPARRSGSWTLFVHQGKKLNKKKAIAFPFRVFVF